MSEEKQDAGLARLEERKKELEFIQNPRYRDESEAGQPIGISNPKGTGVLTRLPGHIRKILSKSFANITGAIGAYPGGGGLSAIKSAFQVERMNDAFGILGWDVEHRVYQIFDKPVYKTPMDLLDKDGKVVMNNWGKPVKNKNGDVAYYIKYVLMEVRVYIREYDLYSPWMFGGWPIDDYNQEPGDAFKSAVTDGLSKVLGLHFEIGIQVFKGHPESLIGNESKAHTAVEQKRLEDEYIASKLPAKKEAPKDEAPKDEAPKEEGEDESTGGKLPTAPFTLDELKNISTSALAVEFFEKNNVSMDSFEQLTGNKRITKPAIERYYVSLFGENPNIERIIESEKDEPGTSTEGPKEEKPSTKPPTEEKQQNEGVGSGSGELVDGSGTEDSSNEPDGAEATETVDPEAETDTEVDAPNVEEESTDVPLKGDPDALL